MPSSLDVKKQYGLRSNWRGGLALGRDVLLLAIALFVAMNYSSNVLIAIGIIWFIGMLQFAMGESLLHEASHGNLFASVWLNSLVGNVIGFAIFTTMDAWRKEHSVHHGHLLSAEDHLSTDYVNYRLYKGYHPFVIWVAQPVLGWVGWQWAVSEVPALFKHWGVFVFYSLLGLFCYFTNTLTVLFIYWLLPLVWAYSSILYWSEITDHYLAKSETRSNLSLFWNVMFHNGGYHWVHHQYPFIPWYLLPKADEALTPATTDSVGGWWEMYQVMVADYRQGATR
ncbi:MAG: fatty acid desaturase [Cyanobacteria bacterium P01_F01_bin.53]